MKAILMSIKPKYCELIASEKKTVEVRKTKPKIDVPFKCYIYETKGKLRWCNKCNNTDCERPYPNCACYEGWGKVIGEFVCDRIDEYTNYSLEEQRGHIERREKLLRNACLTLRDWYNYIGNYTSDKGYAWHITDLVIYDKPKELYEFLNYNKYQVCKEKGCFSDDCWICPNNAIVTKPPQSYFYIDVDELGV